MGRVILNVIKEGLELSILCIVLLMQKLAQKLLYLLTKKRNKNEMKKIAALILCSFIVSQSGCHIVLGYLFDGPPKEGRKSNK